MSVLLDLTWLKRGGDVEAELLNLELACKRQIARGEVPPEAALGAVEADLARLRASVCDLTAALSTPTPPARREG